MGTGFNDFNRLGAEETSLRGLAFELKSPLISIARQAELGGSGSYQSIQEVAEQALMLIDSHLLNAQTEYGQVMLELTPANIGSVLYDVSSQLRAQAKHHNITLVLDDRTHEAVMTHRLALTSILAACGSSLMGLESDSREIILRGYKTRAGQLGVGMFAKASLSQPDIEKGLGLQGRAHMPFSRLNSRPHASLAIAASLCRAVGGQMKVKHMGGLSGFATELPRSEQLSFV